jgi:hypothetical protein
MIRWPQIAHFSAVCWNPEYCNTANILNMHKKISYLLKEMTWPSTAN